MKLVWCPESASKAYIDTVKTLADGNGNDRNVAELVSAMAGGWKARCIVEAWAQGDGVATSIGLATAARHNEGRHVCVVPDERSMSEYAEAMRNSGGGAVEVMVGEAEEVMEGISAIDFVVVDCLRKDSPRILRSARLGPRGAVLVCMAAGAASRWSAGSPIGFRWRGALMAGTRVVRSVFLPVGRGLEVVHVGVGRGPSLADNSRWIKRVDQETGEEHVFRR